MRDNLPRIMDHALDGIMVVSLYDDSIVYTNPVARKFFPSATEDANMQDVLADVARRDGYITSMKTSGYGQLKENRELPFSVVHAPLRGGLWSIGSHLPEVPGFPPTAIFTFTPGDGSEATRMQAFAQHMRTALGARIAIELDEAKRDITNATVMLQQAHGRVDALTEALVSAASSYAEMHSLGDLGTLSG